MSEPVTLNSRKSGKGPLLVILHGLFGNLDNFASVALHLERHLTVVRLDLPGHGRSPTLDDLDPASMARSVKHTLVELGIDRCHLLGHSLGGKVAMALAGDPGDLTLESLIVEDIAPKRYPPHHESMLDALRALDLDTLNNRNDADTRLRPDIEDAGVRAFLLKSLYRADDGRYGWRFDLDGLHRDYDGIADAPPIATQIQTRTLFIKGGDSNYLQEADEPKIREHVANPELMVIGGTGHWPHAEKPALFARVVREFVTGTSAE